MVAVRSNALRIIDPELQDAMAELARDRPRTRADCAKLPRPCPIIGCRKHMLEVTVSSDGTMTIAGRELAIGASPMTVERFTDAISDAIVEMDPARSCSLDIVEQRGEMTLEETGDVLQVTRERIRQIEKRTLLESVRKPLRRSGIPEAMAEWRDYARRKPAIVEEPARVHRSPRRKLSDDDVAEIRRLLVAGVSKAELARRWRVTTTTIYAWTQRGRLAASEHLVEEPTGESDLG